MDLDSPPSTPRTQKTTKVETKTTTTTLISSTTSTVTSTTTVVTTNNNNNNTNNNNDDDVDENSDFYLCVTPHCDTTTGAFTGKFDTKIGKLCDEDDVEGTPSKLSAV